MKQIVGGVKDIRMGLSSKCKKIQAQIYVNNHQEFVDIHSITYSYGDVAEYRRQVTLKEIVTT